MIEWFGFTAAGEAERTLALAGVYQCAALVQGVARGTSPPKDAIEVSLNSILCTDPSSTMEVYGSLGALRVGFHALSKQIGQQPGTRDLEISRYVSNLIVLERSLSKNDTMRDIIGTGVAEAAAVAQRDGLGDPEVIRALARVYKSTLSTLTPRIMVSGEPARLSQDENADVIRALLLAAVRSAVLWRQLGGSRRRLLVTRRLVAGLALDALSRVDDDQSE
jgi:high frequency lysogenization protein